MTKKALSLPVLISLVIGNMIGTGIYVLPSSLAEYGSISLLSWLFTSIGAMLMALILAHLNSRFPQTGGPYVYCKEAFGRFAGFIVSYSYWVCNMISIAGIAVASVGYLGFIYPIFDATTPAYQPYFTLAFELAIVWFFTWLNIVGIQAAGFAQLILTIIKTIPLVLVAIIGLWFIHFDNLNHFTPANGSSQFSAFSSAAALTFWAFIGIEAATVPSEHSHSTRDVYKATVYGTLATVLIYIISTVVLMGLIPPDQLKSSQFPFATAATLLFGQHAAIFIALCAFVSGIGALNVCVLLQGQISFAAARDQIFPKSFAQLSKSGMPVLAQLVSSGIVTIFLIATMQPTLLKQFNNIALLAAIFVLVVYFLTLLAEVKFILASRPSLLHLIANKYFIMSIFTAIFVVCMLSSIEIHMAVSSILLLLLSFPIYFFTVRKYTPATT